MFDPSEPRVFALAPGVDFPRALVDGLRARLAGAAPEAMGRVTLYVNTERMRRRVVEIFTAGPPALLPRIRLVTDLARDPALALPAAVPPLRRRLELARLIDGLITAAPDLAPRTALFDLAETLADLMDEMQGEGVAPEAVSSLDVSDHSAHWARTQSFIGIIAPYFTATAEPDMEARQRLAVEAVIRRWAADPPADPVIVAGSTGSRGTTARLMTAVAGLPHGALVLPGYDFDMPLGVWATLDDALTAEDHPQFRFHRLLSALSLAPDAVRPWAIGDAPDPARNRVVSLALRPAPVTDQWLTDGPALPDLPGAMRDVTLIEAPSPRAEALSIALVLRDAAEDGRTAALITPDRTLARQVTAALDRWGILPDDSGGQPLALSPPGRLLRQVARAMGRVMTVEILLSLLKHPLTHSGADRGPHLRHTRELELRLRRDGPVFPTGADLIAWAGSGDAAGWAAWLAGVLDAMGAAAAGPLADCVAAHLACTGTLAQGQGAGTGALWAVEAGEEARAAMTLLADEAAHGGVFTPAGYADLIDALLDTGQVRSAALPHPTIRIWGTLEARVQGADLVVLGGLNEGVWPGAAAPDPWLNRQMRLKAGLLLPERRIGLSAHDFQQAVAAPCVVLTRALRDSEAQTTPSRWVNRVVNLLLGLPGRQGPEALRDMRARGAVWLAHAQRLEVPEVPIPRAHRPAPRPPVTARPRKLAVTGIKTLIRDPYAIYARHILRLYKIDPIAAEPDARRRGTLLHDVLETYARAMPEGGESPVRARDRLIATATEVLARTVPWPAARALWRARITRVAGWLVAFDARDGGIPAVLEEEGRVTLQALGFTLTARPDRIDRMADGRLHLIDYKTGSPPTPKEQRFFDKQLILEAAMAARGGFATLGQAEVARISYLGLGSPPKQDTQALDTEVLDAAWAGLEALLTAYADQGRGYVSRRAVQKQNFVGDYDHLARYGEWEVTDDPRPEDVG